MATGPPPPSPGRSNAQSHAPATPSGLRQSYTPRDSEGRAAGGSGSGSGSSAPPSPDASPEVRPRLGVDGVDADDAPQAGPSVSASASARRPPTETTALLKGLLEERECSHEGQCNHGTFSPRPGSPVASVRSSETDRDSAEDSDAGLPLIDSLITTVTGSKNVSWRRRWARNMRSKKMSRSSQLAERHGVKDTGFMSVSASPSRPAVRRC